MSIRITECSDVDLLNQIIRDESVYPYIGDDTSPSAEDFTCEHLVADERNKFLMVYDEYEPVGCFAFLGDEMHTCLLRTCRGRSAITAGRLAIAKMLNEGRERITSFAFEEQPQTIWYARMIGLEQVGEPFVCDRMRGGEPATRINFKLERN